MSRGLSNYRRNDAGRGIRRSLTHFLLNVHRDIAARVYLRFDTKQDARRTEGNCLCKDAVAPGLHTCRDGRTRGDRHFSSDLKIGDHVVVEFPDLRVSGPGFKDTKKISNANPQQADYLWGHRLLFDFKDRDGHKLQGILAIPDDYKPGEKRPRVSSTGEMWKKIALISSSAA